MLKGSNADLAVGVHELSQAFAQLARAQGARFVADTADVWANLARRIDSYNPSFGRELSALPHGGFAIDPERLSNFMQRLTSPSMVLTYVIFVPRRLGFGAHPLDAALRLVALVRACRDIAKSKGGQLAVVPRVFLIDGPRPVGSFFLSYRELADGFRAVALQYSRSLEPGGRDIPTADRMLIEHADAEVDRLSDFYDEKVANSMEISWERLETALAPLLKSGAMVGADLEAITVQLYAEAVGPHNDLVENGDHIVVKAIRPSRYGAAPHNHPHNTSALAKVTLVEGQDTQPKNRLSWSSHLINNIRRWAGPST